MRFVRLVPLFGAVTLAFLFLSQIGVGQGKKDGKAGEINTPPAPGERKVTKLRLGDPAPDFTLPDLKRTKETRLSSFQGKKPVVLIFGSYT